MRFTVLQTQLLPGNMLKCLQRPQNKVQNEVQRNDMSNACSVSTECNVFFPKPSARCKIFSLIFWVDILQQLWFPEHVDAPSASRVPHTHGQPISPNHQGSHACQLSIQHCKPKPEALSHRATYISTRTCIFLCWIILHYTHSFSQMCNPKIGSNMVE